VPGVNQSTILNMCRTLVHRGPDDEGTFLDQQVALASRRLSIIDIQSGHQPLSSQDGSVILTFNGEVYNHRELRRDLEKRGHHFRTRSDTEVVLESYLAYGSDFVQHLDGMFAIALYDTRRRRVLLARDHIGIKPLFYCHTGNHLIWGSEIKALLSSGLVERQLNVVAAAQFMQWEYVPSPHTLFSSIYKMEPGTLLEVDLSRAPATLRHSTFWSIPVCIPSTSITDWEAVLLEAVNRSTQEQLISDVPLGVLLSGGVDSSLLASCIGPAKAFSLGFEDLDYNELPYAKATATHLGLDWHTEIADAQMVELFDQLMFHLDDPIADTSIFPSFLLSRLARQHVKVALSGDGGDELFAGYETYLAQSVTNRLGPLANILGSAVAQRAVGALRPTAKKKGIVNKLKRFSDGLAHANELRHARWRSFISPQLASELYSGQFAQEHEQVVNEHIVRLYRESDGLDDINRALFVDAKSYLLDNCLVKTDRMSMACSLEVRVPLLSRRLVELAFNMPGAMKVHRGVGKYVLKRVAARRVPRHCVYRPKEGFSMPLKKWLGGQFRPILEEATCPAALNELGLFCANSVARLKAEHLSGRANHSHVLWSLVILHNWKKRWLDA
jgi:asparagine synthase (glutamine-hydrolysing)